MVEKLETFLGNETILYDTVKAPVFIKLTEFYYKRGALLYAN